jgi:hypothetical protein
MLILAVIIGPQFARAASRCFLVFSLFRIRTSAKRSRNCFRIRTSLPHLDLRIPKHLALRNFSRNSFRFCTYQPAGKCGKQTTYNPCRIRTCRKSPCNPFRIRTYKNLGAPPQPALFPLFVTLLPVCWQRQSTPMRSREAHGDSALAAMLLRCARGKSYLGAGQGFCYYRRGRSSMRARIAPARWQVALSLPQRPAQTSGRVRQIGRAS